MIYDIRKILKKECVLFLLITLFTLFHFIKYVNGAEIKTLQLNVQGNGTVNVEYLVKASFDDTEDMMYKFWLHDKSRNEWIALNEYSSTSYYYWIPKIEGSYRIVVHAKDKYSTKEYDDYSYKDITIGLSYSSLTGFIVDGRGYTNSPYELKAQGSGTSEILYKYWLNDKLTGEWIVLKDYSSTSNIRWIPLIKGNYRIVVHTKDKYSNKEYDDYRYQDITVSLPSATITSFPIEMKGFVNTPYDLITHGSGTSELLYKFWLHDKSTDEWIELNEYSLNSRYRWVPKKEGDYRIVVHTRDLYSVKEYDDYRYQDITVSLPSAKITSFPIEMKGFVNTPYDLIAHGSGTSELLYKFWLHDKSTDEWIELNEYSLSSSYKWVPKKEGEYRLVVHAKDQFSFAEYDDYTYKDILVQKTNSQAVSFSVSEFGYIYTDYNLSAIANGTNEVLYKFWIQHKDSGVWYQLGEFSNISDINWIPNQLGDHRLVVHVKDQYSLNEYDDYIFKDIKVISVNKLVIDNNLKSKYGNEDILISGHASISSGIKSIKIFLNNRLQGTATYDLQQSDNGITLSRFDYLIKRNNLSPGSNTISVELNGTMGEKEIFTKQIDITKIPTIVIDAGHGGKDPGASGYLNGIRVYEKTYALQFAEALNKELISIGFNTIMTRRNDTFIELADRSRIANESHADLFFSIHHDYSSNYNNKGAFLIYPSVKIESTSESTITESMELATLIKSALISMGLQDRRNGSDQSISGHTLHVLRQTNMKSVLAEIGYMSNQDDLMKIVDPVFQKASAKTIAAKIKYYFGL